METIGANRRGEVWNHKSETVRPTSGLVELQGDVSVEAQAEVVVEHIQRQLRRQEKVKVTQGLRYLFRGWSQLAHYSPWTWNSSAIWDDLLI